MTGSKFVGAMLEPRFTRMIEDTAREEGLDRTSALRELIQHGRRKLLENRAIELYREGRISVDRAAAMLSITVPEAMRLFANAGIRSEETMEEYSSGLKLLLGKYRGLR